MQLSADTFYISGQLEFSASGIVIRGANNGNTGTTLIATGKDRRSLIHIRKEDTAILAQRLNVTDERVAAGSSVLNLQNVNGLNIGGRVVVIRSSTKEWIRKA